MRWLENGQSAMMQAIDHGPAHLSAEVFAGSPERVLAGFKVHANTISHARLVALEDTFPRTRECIGDDRFNQCSRMFIEQPGVTARSLAQIGDGFGRFLIEQGEAVSSGSLAQFEWLWLKAYHAADAEPLALSALIELAPEALADQAVQRHPAACAACYERGVNELIGAQVPGLSQAQAILIARPYAEVLISPASTLMADLLAAVEKPLTIGNLLAWAGERTGAGATSVDEIMHALVALVTAGAIAAGETP